MQLKNRDSVEKVELLYDPQTLRHYRDEYGIAEEIKHGVKTMAAIYEIRTALRYWLGGRNTHRTSDRIWGRCEAVDEGNLAVGDNELVYEEDL